MTEQKNLIPIKRGLETVFSLAALRTLNNMQIKLRKVMVGELKDAWNSVLRVRQKAAAGRTCPNRRPQIAKLATKQGLAENYELVNGIKGNTNAFCGGCQHLNATVGQSTVSRHINIPLK